MVDLASIAESKSTTISDLKKRATVIHQEVGHDGLLYSVRSGTSLQTATSFQIAALHQSVYPLPHPLTPFSLPHARG